MRKTTTLFILCFVLLKINLQAQSNGIIKGKISDSQTKEALPGAIISTSAKSGVSSDMNGNYFISSPAGKQELECSMVGYKTQKQSVDVKENDTVIVNFTMSDANTLLEEVVVSAGKFEQKLSDVTVSMEVIKPALLENKNTTSLDQIMNQVPGVTISDGQASIRGGSGFAYGAGSRVLMMVDEMPMLSADAGDVKWNYLPIENLEQVEVIKGASSALFGSSALNGVINLRTAYAKDKPLTSVTIYGGGYDAPKYQYKWWKGSSQQQKGLNFSHAEKIKNLDLVLGGHMYDDDGYRMLETEKRARFNANLRYNFKKIPGLSVGVNTNMMDVKGGLFFLWAHADSAYLVPYTITPKDTIRSIQNYKNKRFNIDPFITYFFGKNNKLSFRSRYFITKNNNDKNQEATSELYFTDLQYQKRFKNDLTLTLGAVYSEQQIFSEALYGRHTGKNTAGYLQVDKKIKRLTMSLGLRGEYYKVDTAYTRGYISKNIKDLPFQPVARAGLNYQLFDYTFLRASFGQGYRFPSVAEKFISTNVSVLKIYPNESLQPERGWSAEVGVKQGFSISKFKGFLDVAGFWTEYTNMVEFVFDVYIPDGKATGFPFIDAVNYAGFKSQNLGRAQIKGIDVTVSGGGKIGPIGVSLFTGYTYIDPINPNFNPAVDTLGLPGLNVLKYRNRHLFKGDIQLDYKFVSVGFSTRWQSYVENIDRRFTQSIFHEDTNVEWDAIEATYILPGLPKYRQKDKAGSWVHDMRIGFQVSKNVKLSYIVNNLANEEYSTRPGDVRPPRLHTLQIIVKL